jgi:hypothetical protein
MVVKWRKKSTAANKMNVGDDQQESSFAAGPRPCHGTVQDDPIRSFSEL